MVLPDAKLSAITSQTQGFVSSSVSPPEAFSVVKEGLCLAGVGHMVDVCFLDIVALGRITAS